MKITGSIIVGIFIWTIFVVTVFLAVVINAAKFATKKYYYINYFKGIYVIIGFIFFVAFSIVSTKIANNNYARRVVGVDYGC